MNSILSANAGPTNTECPSAPRGSLQLPHTADMADKPPGEGDVVAAAPGDEPAGEEHLRHRVLSVKLDFREMPDVFKRVVDLGWQAARYRNVKMRGFWAEAKNLCVQTDKGETSVSKWIRANDKGDLSGAVYSAAEQETRAVWGRLKSRILAGAPLPEWKPTAAITIRGHKNKNESGVTLRENADGEFIAHLSLQNKHCQGGCWFDIPIMRGTQMDWQADILRDMVAWKIPIRKAAIVVKLKRHQIILRLSYSLPYTIPRFGDRVATLGPVTRGYQLFLRTESQTRDYSNKLHTLIEKKESWDKIRRRITAQIGRKKGGARAKRKILARLSWDDWLTTFLHTWSREIIDWLETQGVSKLVVTGLEGADWAQFKFTNFLTWKGDDKGITINQDVDLAEKGSERAVKAAVQKQRHKATKMANALRELTYQTKQGES